MSDSTSPVVTRPPSTLYLPVLLAISGVHLLNDAMQAVIPALNPYFEKYLQLTLTQIGFISLANNLTASLMQPLVGHWTDRRPQPWLLPAGMVSTGLGMAWLATAGGDLHQLVGAVMLVGVGSAVFHPEASRIVMLAAHSGRRGLAQSTFQVCGNAGQSLAPVMSILLFTQAGGQRGALWFTGVAVLGALVQTGVARWYAGQLRQPVVSNRPVVQLRNLHPAVRRRIVTAVVLIVLLTFGRTWFVAGISNFFALYLIKVRQVPETAAQIYLTVFLLAGALGTFVGGPLGDRFGRKNAILCSLGGAIPLALLLPHVNLFWTYPVLAGAGFTILAGFSATLMYALDLVPGKVGTISGLMFGLAFGMAALGAQALGILGDRIGLEKMILVTSVLPIIGLFTVLLPQDSVVRRWHGMDT